MSVNDDPMPGPRCLNCNYFLSNLPEPRCPECGRTFDLKDPRSFRSGSLSRLSLYWLSPPGKFSKWMTLLPSAALIISQAYPEGVFMLDILGFFGWFLLLAWWLVRLIIWCVASLITGFEHHRPGTAPAWAKTPLIFAILIVCIFLRLPLYATFLVSLPSMSRIAQQSVNSGAPPKMSWIGIYPVERIEVIAGGMRFIVSGTGFMNQGALPTVQTDHPSASGKIITVLCSGRGMSGKPVGDGISVHFSGNIL